MGGQSPVAIAPRHAAAGLGISIMGSWTCVQFGVDVRFNHKKPRLVGAA